MQIAIERMIESLNGSNNTDFQELYRDATEVPASERYQPSMLNLNIACLTGNVLLIREMLAGDDVSPQYLPSEKYYWMAYGHTEIVKALLEDERFDPRDDDAFPFLTACQYGWEESLQLLLEDGRVDPNGHFGDDYPILEAVAVGSVGAVRLLLRDRRADPTIEDNHCVILAAERGYEKIVKLLLADRRVDASDQDNEAIRLAIAGKHWGVVWLLARDYRVMRSLTSDERYIAEKILRSY